jgi:cation:H+ antiporter
VIGLALLTVGGRWLVTAAESIALGLGLSETIVGLTIVAAGTSLPEAVTSIVAAVRGQRDMAVGNAVGSSILNILMVLGIVSIVSAEPVPVARAIVTFDLPLMIAVAAACLPILFTGHVIARWEGALFLAYYAAYTAYLFLDATEHDALPAFSRAMVAFVGPITAVTLVLLAWRARSSALRPEGRGS